MTMTYRRWVGPALLVAGAAFALAACSGSSPPQVASLGNGRGGASASSTTTLPAASATQLLDQWASCMRSHGDPDQVDPTIDTTKVIQITLPAGYAGGLHGGTCGTYLNAAQRALGGGSIPGTASQATALKFAQCMRANGISDYPDPSGNGSNQALHASSGSDLNPASPTFQAATTLCSKQTGFQSKFGSGPAQPGSINLTMAGGFGGKSDGNSGSAANSGG